MLNANRFISWLFLICSLYTTSLIADSNCQKPFLKSFSEISINSAKMDWFDNNANAVGWEMEIGLIGFNRTETANTPLVTIKEYTFTGLAASKRYEVWIRTDCNTCNSGWNGPFIFNTNIENGNACNIGLELKDDNCPLAEEYSISVNNAAGNALGTNIFIEEINLIISHDWPSDLKLELSSPSGKTIRLIDHRGIGQDHLGIPAQGECLSSLSFTNEACNEIALYNGPLNGSFKPEDDINIFLDDTDPNGVWQLKVCDRAQEDQGILEHVEIKFNTEVCPIPAQIIIKEINVSQATMTWDAPFNCSVLQYKVGPTGGDVNSFVCNFLNCQLGQKELLGLAPGTSYDLYVKSECFQVNSPFSCAMTFTTACAALSELENFDNEQTCLTSCITSCPLNGQWSNATADDHDWIVHDQSTPSSFTGPDSDPFECGNYIYIENSVGICGENKTAILESNCLSVHANGCDFSFYYHMFGVNSNRLTLELSEDQGDTWVEIWGLIGSKDDSWIRQEIDLSLFNQKMVKLRFTAYSGNGTAADIAIDQLEFYGSQFIDDGTAVFEDKDLDGFGTGDTLRYCGINIPSNLSTNNLDCNDNDVLINPAQSESPCNLIDENCNGLEDDLAPVNPISYDVVTQNNESCLGSADGSISISVSGGSSPYEIDWNNQMLGSSLSNLSKGIYYATITDATGCMASVDFIELDAQVSMQLFVQTISTPLCNGVDNGSIAIVANGGTAPYSFLWSNGEDTQTAMMLSAGTHQVTITDALGCSLVSQEFQLLAPPLLEAGTQLVTDVNCYGGNDGSILISVIQGTPPYQIMWNTMDDTALITQLTAGFYSCTITDGLGCIKRLDSIEVSQKDSLQIFIDGIEDIRCANDQDGRIEISIEGGTSPYSYFWNTGAFTDDLFDLDVGIFHVTVTDINGCSKSLENISINAPDPITASIDSIIHVDCPFSDNGYVALNVSGGTGNYNFFWNTLSDNSPIQDSLTTGTYGLTIIDDFNCKETPINIDIDAINDSLGVVIVDQVDNLCFGESNGSISVAVFSARTPFDFNWSAGVQNTSVIAQDLIIGLANDKYNVTVTDTEGCVGTSDSVTIDSPQDLIFSIDSLTNISCHGDTSGLIGLDVQGGILPYDIVWSNLDTGSMITNLSAGIYDFKITDANGCMKMSQDVAITQPDSLSLTAIVTDELSSNGLGSIITQAQGGTPGYQYIWGSNAMTGDDPDALMLSSDWYSLSLVDMNSCLLDTLIFVDNISALSPIPQSGVKLLNNLSSDYLSLQSTSSSLTKARFQIINAEGIMMTSDVLRLSPQNVEEISISTFPAGTYFLKVLMGQKIEVFKFIKI